MPPGFGNCPLFPGVLLVSPSSSSIGLRTIFFQPFFLRKLYSPTIGQYLPITHLFAFIFRVISPFDFCFSLIFALFLSFYFTNFFSLWFPFTFSPLNISVDPPPPTEGRANIFNRLMQIHPLQNKAMQCFSSLIITISPNGTCVFFFVFFNSLCCHRNLFFFQFLSKFPLKMFDFHFHPPPPWGTIIKRRPWLYRKFSRFV